MNRCLTGLLLLGLLGCRTLPDDEFGPGKKKPINIKTDDEKKKEPINFIIKYKPKIVIDYDKIIDTKKTRLVIQNGHTEHIADLALSPDGQLIASVAADRTLKIWNIRGILLKDVQLRNQNPKWVRFYDKGRKIAVGMHRKAGVRLYSISGKLLREIKDKKHPIDVAAFSEDLQFIVTSDGYRDVQIRNQKFKVLKSFHAHDGWVRFIKFVPGSNNFLTGGSRTRTSLGWYSASRIWHPNGKLLQEIDMRIPDNISTEETQKRKHAEREKARRGKAWRDVKRRVPDVVIWADFSPDGKYVATVSKNHVLNIRTTKGKLIGNIKNVFSKRVFFTHDSNKVVAINSWDYIVYNFKGKILRKRKFRNRKERGTVVNSGALTPDSRLVITGLSNPRAGLIRFYDINGPLKRQLGHSGDQFYRTQFDTSLNRILLEKKQRPKVSSYFHINGRIEDLKERAYFDALGREIRFKYKGSELIVRQDNQLNRFTKRYSHRMVPTPGGTIALFNRGSITFFKISGEPIRNTKYRAGSTGSLSSLYGPVFSPDMSYFVFETATSHGGIHNIGLFDYETGKRFHSIKTDYRLEKAAVGPGGKLIATGHENGLIKVYTRKGKKLKTLRSHLIEITGLDFSHDGNFLISTAKDRTIKIWNLKTKRFLTLFIFPNKDWLVIDEFGRFDGSDVKKEVVHFVKGLKAYQLEQFWQTLYYPNLIKDFLNPKKPMKKLEPLQEPPVVTITELKQNKQTVRLKVCTNVSKNKIKKIALRHNGRILSDRAFKVQLARRCRIFTVNMLEGENRFEGIVLAKNNPNSGFSNTISIYFEALSTIKPDMHILAIGVSAYRDKNLSLYSAAKDARDISQALSDISKKIYRKTHVHLLDNTRASKKNITAKLESIARGSAQRDTVILFLAGHGDLDGGEFYFLPYDADLTRLNQTAVSLAQIKSFSRRVRANKIAIILDTCKSGAVVEELRTVALSRGLAEKRLIARLAKDQGIAVFSAANASQKAYEVKALGQGIFTFALLEALRQKSVARDGIISIARLLAYANLRTRALAYEHLKVEQSPIMYLFGDDFAIGYRR